MLMVISYQYISYLVDYDFLCLYMIREEKKDIDRKMKMERDIKIDLERERERVSERER